LTFLPLFDKKSYNPTLFIVTFSAKFDVVSFKTPSFVPIFGKNIFKITTLTPCYLENALVAADHVDRKLRFQAELDRK
jgi:hypothetical protein